MATFQCDCGFSKVVPDQYIGRKVKCPRCGVTTTLQDGDDAEIFEDEFDENSYTMQNQDDDYDDVDDDIEDYEDEPEYDFSINTKKPKPSTNLIDIPKKISELIHSNEIIQYAARPSLNSLILRFFINSFFYILLIGILLYQKEFLYSALTLLILLVTIVLIYFSWRNMYYVITETRTIVSQGMFNVVTKIIQNNNIQIVSINSGIIDRWLDLNSIEISTAGQGGGIGSLLFFIPGMAAGSVTLKHVKVKEVVVHYHKDLK